MVERERWLAGHITDDEYNRGAATAGMVNRFRAVLLPNGLVRLFCHSTFTTTLFEACGYREDGRRVITIRSGPEVDKAGWDAAYAAFPRRSE